ncbi:MAG TPA: esterase, partial [Cyanobacteria bacterium UBA11049]|nr:esterase [Cyanobacteria bacterium UBA11049]
AYPHSSSLTTDEIGGAAVICPSLDSIRSLSYLVKHPVGKYLEQAIARGLKELAYRIYAAHPEAIDPAAIERANSIWGFDHELVIGRLGFPSVEAYYEASSGLHLLPNLEKPTLIIYAADDPLFDPTIVPDLQAASEGNPNIDLILTRYGGHVGYLSSKACQARMGDRDPWWAWNRVLEWIEKL